MTDWLARAWNVLDEGERPAIFVGDSGWETATKAPLPTWIAALMLERAVENVLLEKYALHHVHGRDNKHHWGAPPNSDFSWEDRGEPHPNRHAAAVLALESERGVKRD